MRSKKALRNIVFSILLELTTIISSFLVPKIIISKFGSDINGLATSITQFLGYIVLLQSGIGGVVKASLYKPLANKDIKHISKIVNATERFFRKLGIITIVYIFILAILLTLNSPSFDSVFTFSLVVIIGIQAFGEYFFGITYQMLLEAGQNQYIYSITQISCVVLSTIITIILANVYPNIHLIKLIASLFFIIRPLVLRKIVYKKYQIKKLKSKDTSILNNRWDGVGHTVAYFIHNKTDILVLYLFTSLESVSIYSVYALIANGLRSIINTISNPLQATFGNIIAKKELKVLDSRFKQFELIVNMASSILFPVGAALAIPFVRLYSKDFDSNYVFPLFSLLILLAEYFYCIRLPYHIIIISAGHYRQTKRGAFIEAGINIIMSLILVKPLGLVGVAIGTLAAMIYRTIDYVLYLRKDIINRNVLYGFTRIGITTITFFAVYYLLSVINMKIDDIKDFIIAGIMYTAISTVIVFIINGAIYRNTLKGAIKIFNPKKLLRKS